MRVCYECRNMRQKKSSEEDECRDLILTCKCFDAFEFVFVDIFEEWSTGLVSGRVAAWSYKSCLSLKINTSTDRPTELVILDIY